MNYGAEIVDLRDVRFTPELLSVIPGATARMYSVLPIADTIDGLVIATAHPFNLEAIDDLNRIVGRDIEIRCADADQLRDFIKNYYGG
jgi:hypothetical protein